MERRYESLSISPRGHWYRGPVLKNVLRELINLLSLLDKLAASFHPNCALSS